MGREWLSAVAMAVAVLREMARLARGDDGQIKTGNAQLPQHRLARGIGPDHIGQLASEVLGHLFIAINSKDVIAHLNELMSQAGAKAAQPDNCRLLHHKNLPNLF